MDTQIEATKASNTLKYLYLLPEEEQLNELNIILAFMKWCQRKYHLLSTRRLKVYKQI